MLHVCLIEPCIHPPSAGCAPPPAAAEDDESLTADEKALLRFQKQRLKELAGGKFTLPDEEGGEGGEQLTHMGQSLAELDDAQEVR